MQTTYDKYHQPIVWPAKLNHVPKEIFVREDVYQEELKRIFYGKEWHAVCHDAEIPNKGDFKTHHIGRVPLIIARDENGQVNVMYNSCSHRGNLVETRTRGNRKQFECPYHRWIFDMRGDLIATGPTDAYTPGFDKANYPLDRPRFEILHGIVFVTLHPDTMPLAQYLGDIADKMKEVMFGDGRLRLLGYQKVIFKSNWKCYGDNDAYHAGFLHTAFRMLNWQGGKGVQWAGPTGHRGFYGQLSLPKSTSFLKDPSLIEYRGANLEKGSQSVHLFPMFVCIRHMDSVALRFSNPLSVDETEMHYVNFAHADDDEEMVRHRVRQGTNLLGPCGMVSMEDAAMFHRLHLGAFSPGDAIFQKGVKDEYAIPDTFLQNDETGNLLGWVYYRDLMGFAKEEA